MQKEFSRAPVDFLGKYCVIDAEKTKRYRAAFKYVDDDDDGYIDGFQVPGLIDERKVLIQK